MVTLEYTPSGSLNSLEVAGEFNNWTPASLSAAGDGSWSIELGELAPGEYAYKFIMDGSYESSIPANVYTKWSGGVENRNLRVGDCTRPLLQPVSGTADALGNLNALFQLASAEDGAALDPASVTVTVGGEPTEAMIDVALGTIKISLSGLPPGKHSVKVWASDTSGRLAEGAPAWVPLWVEDSTYSWEDGLIYFAFTDRFRNGDYGQEAPYGPVEGVPDASNYQGGDFLGIIHALEEGYFQELGVNTIWLSPVYTNADGGFLGTDGTHTYTGYHGYWPISASGIEEHFSDVDAEAAERLDELIALAHSQGIRVLFDLVLNHVHEDHDYLNQHPDWFGGGCVCGTTGCGWDEKPVECWFTDYLPDLDYKNHAVLQQVVADTLALIRDHDIDAVRIDAAKHMDHVVMRTLSMRLRDEVERASGVEIYSVGETFSSNRGEIMNYVAPYELDGQFDFPLYYAIRSSFIDNSSFRNLETAVADGQAAYGDAWMSPFLGNHDVERFATDITGIAGDPWSGALSDPMSEGGASITEWDVINRISAAFAFTLTQPGVPLIYYGDEIGLAGGGDPDNRRMMNFDPYLSANQAELLARVQAIGQARAQSEALRRGSRIQLWVDDDLLVYARDLGGGDTAVVAINKGSSRSQSIPISLVGEGTVFEDALGSGWEVTVSGGSLSLSLGSWDYIILVVQ
jgi:glycosidase